MRSRWQVLPSSQIELQAEYPELLPVIWQLLANRQLLTSAQVEEFFNQDLKLFDPWLLRQMEPACQLIIATIKARQPIAVVADYDADGVTAAVVLIEVLRALSATATVWIPSRLGDGYGLNRRIIDDVVAAVLDERGDIEEVFVGVFFVGYGAVYFYLIWCHC